MIIRDKYGWPLELFKGHPITNFIRKCLHGNFLATWKYRNLASEKTVTDDSNQVEGTTHE